MGWVLFNLTVIGAVWWFGGKVRRASDQVEAILREEERRSWR